MDGKKQKLLIEYLISSPDTFAICQGIVQPQYFNPEFRNAVQFIKTYYEQFHTTPRPIQVKAETGVELIQRDIAFDEIKYTSQEIEAFCQRSAFEKAVLAAPSRISEGDFDGVMKSVSDALLISINKNLGLRYFDDPRSRLERMLENDPVIPTGWKELDEYLYGGICRKELVLVSANSGGGKSITLANLGFNFIHQGLNVLYVTFELSEEIVAQRYDTMFTGISRKNWKKYVTEIATKLESKKSYVADIDIVQMKSGTKPRDIQAFLKNYYHHYKMMPDLIILDYLDKMIPNERVNLSDMFTKDKLVSEQSRDIGIEYDVCVASASQLNREAIKAIRHDHSHIGGGISKINESDIWWTIKMTDLMRASGEMVFDIQKTRNSDGVGNLVHMQWDKSHLRILDRPELKNSDSLVLKKREKSPINYAIDMGDGNGLIDLMSELSDNI